MIEMCSKIGKIGEGMLPVDCEMKDQSDPFSDYNHLPNLGSFSPTRAFRSKNKSLGIYRIHLCKFCKKTFYNTSALTDHMNQFHKQEQSQIEPVNIEKILRQLPKDVRILVKKGDCGASSKRRLVVPLERVPPNQSLKGILVCPKCPRTFVQPIPLLRHIRFGHFSKDQKQSKSEKKDEAKSSILQTKTENKQKTNNKTRKTPQSCPDCNVVFRYYFEYLNHRHDSPTKIKALEVEKVPAHKDNKPMAKEVTKDVEETSVEDDSDDGDDPDYSGNTNRKRFQMKRGVKRRRRRICLTPRRPQKIPNEDPSTSDNISMCNLVDLSDSTTDPLEEFPDEKEISSPPSSSASSTPKIITPSSTTSTKFSLIPSLVSPPPPSPISDGVLSDYVPSDCEDNEKVMYGEIAYDVRNRKKTMTDAAKALNMQPIKLKNKLLRYGFSLIKIQAVPTPPVKFDAFVTKSNQDVVVVQQPKEVKRKRGRPRKIPIQEHFNNGDETTRSIGDESSGGEHKIPVTLHQYVQSKNKKPIKRNRLNERNEETKKVGRKRYPIRVDKEALKRAIMSSEPIKRIACRFDLPYFVVRRVRDEECCSSSSPSQYSPMNQSTSQSSMSQTEASFSSSVQIQDPRPLPKAVESCYYKYNHFRGTSEFLQNFKRKRKQQAQHLKVLNSLRGRKFIRVNRVNYPTPLSNFPIKFLMLKTIRRHASFSSPANKHETFKAYMRKLDGKNQESMKSILRRQNISELLNVNPDDLSTDEDESDEEVIEKDNTRGLRLLSYFCNDCNRYFSSLKRITDHNRHIHSSSVQSRDSTDAYDADVSVSDESSMPRFIEPDGILRCEFCNSPCDTEKSLADHYFINHYKEMIDEGHGPNDNHLQPVQNEPTELDNQFIETMNPMIELENVFKRGGPSPGLVAENENTTESEPGSVWDVDDETGGGDESKYFYSNCDCLMRNVFPNEQMRDEHKETVHRERAYNLQLNDNVGNILTFYKMAVLNVERISTPINNV